MMAKRVGIEVSIAAAEAAKLCNVDVVSAYPITPQTHVVEHLSELVSNGELDAEFVQVESEQSAMSVCMGSAAVGARTFTSTAAQGLALMSEMLFIAASMRLPVVMALVNRALSSPLSIWNDHSDVMAQRDCGWIQIFTESGQEVFDNVICAFRMAEDRRVLMPVMVNLDGFILSHVVEPIEITDRETIDRFLPPYKPLHTLHPDKPLTMGAFGMPEIYSEAKKAQDVALRSSLPVIEEVWREWGAVSGRTYKPVETYRCDDAEVAFVAMGSLCQTAEVAVDTLRERGVKAGLVKIRLWRPLPDVELKAVLSRFKRLLIVDRAYSFGAFAGPVATEIGMLLYTADRKPELFNFIAGLGGRDVPMKSFVEMFETAERDSGTGRQKNFYTLEVRE
jgi:pyruvate ferredoxin oxidoreductase alpha subunit